MSSFFTIELDTTAPTLEIYAPKYTTRETENMITIQASEKLSSYQEIYIIDSGGNRFDYVFANNGDYLLGKTKLSDATFGIATLFARVKDEVDNISELYEHSFEVKESISRLRLEISDSVRGMMLEDNTRDLVLDEQVREVITNIEI